MTDFLYTAASRRHVIVQDMPRLRDHGLWRADILAGPARDHTQLPECRQVKHRHIGDNLIAIAAQPQDRWFGVDGVKPADIGLLIRRHAIEYAPPARRGYLANSQRRWSRLDNLFRRHAWPAQM